MTYAIPTISKCHLIGPWWVKASTHRHTPPASRCVACSLLLVLGVCQPQCWLLAGAGTAVPQYADARLGRSLRVPHL